VAGRRPRPLSLAVTFDLSALVTGSPVLIDANIFIYAAIKRSEQCTRLIQRCRDDELLGVTTAEIVSEVCHRLMLSEAAATGLISRESASDLRPKHDVIRKLTRYWAQTVRIFDSNLLVLALDEARHHSAYRIRARYGLLTNDSLIAAAALDYGISCLASRDSDFDRIAELTVYQPSDVP
jgi:predicted nucleic acid-binding protein